MYPRAVANLIINSRKSVLLLGPRQTGKSTLMHSFNPDVTINLMDEAVYLQFAQNPSELKERIAQMHTRKVAIFIDEVQRLPSLLNTIQTIIDSEPNIKFFLTGSSARKLRRGQANLLPGRIHSYYLGPIVACETDYSLDISECLSTGTLPGILSEPSIAERKKTLRTYAATYLKEEIQAESLTRNLEGFARFISVAAEWSGKFLDLSKMAQAAQVDRQSVVRWFEILEDTLVVHRLDAYAKKLSKRLVRHPKFYFFDVGVLNGMLANFTASSDRKGNLFEHFFFSQLLHSAFALDKEIKLSTYRTESGVEVDFIVELDGKQIAIETKHSKHLTGSDLKGLKNFIDYGKPDKAMLAHTGEDKKVIDGIEILPWQIVLQQIGL